MKAAEQTGIHFNNAIAENDSNNILDYEYIYNGGGVAAADFNNDGLQDLYFTGNEVSNKLYLNEGQLSFRDVTQESNTGGNDKWYTGVAVVDINGDGWQDIYVSAARWNDPERRRNELYVNSGVNEDGIPVFEEMAAEYGLDDSSHSTQAAFFDYDNDGDLDMYLLVSDQRQKVSRRSPVSSVDSQEDPNLDKLYRNDWNASEQHPRYVDISKESGIDIPGYGLGVAISDINRDGLKDVYVANDFASDDLLWINNGDGTFTDKAADYFKHTSFSSMGTEIADINNDGLQDVVTLDMLPENNYRKKTMTNPNNYINYANNAFGRINPQFTRNTLQLNRGPRLAKADTVAPPIFSEIAYLSGIAETDWSWGALLADFDNDGYRDLLVTNGTPGDKTDKDFVNYRDRLGNIAGQATLLDSIPEVKIANYVYRNSGKLVFENVTANWGLDEASFSNGAAWVDLDNDGDLDIVVNNINQDAFLYENTMGAEGEEGNNWLQVKVTGTEKNPDGLGAQIDIYYGNGQMQTYENTPYRGYLSSVEDIAHFGLGETTLIDSMAVTLPTGEHKVWEKPEANRQFEADLSNAGKTKHKDRRFALERESRFKDITRERGIDFVHREREYDDFQVQRLLPYKLSQYGPSLAAGDVDGNGTQDLFIGGSYDYWGTFLLQNEDGTFTEKKLLPDDNQGRKPIEDGGVLLFDADSDGDRDLYIVSGSIENRRGSENFRDRFYENDGDGNFEYRPDALPRIRESGLAVKAADYDQDGDLDLFVGGRVIPDFYPLPASSYILRNDSDEQGIKFTNVTPDVAEPLREIGMVTDALWSDFDNDGRVDLILSGEWMPITFLKNRDGKFVDVTPETGIADKVGWWNSLAGGDFDGDGDIDYIAGNLGLNSLYRASDEEPVGIYAKDFSNSGLFAAIPTTFVPDSEGVKREYPVHARNDVMQMLRRRAPYFQTHERYSTSTIHDILSPQDLEGALIYKANYMESAYIENLGEGKFKISNLPIEAQFAPVFGLLADDFNNDGNLDVMLSGNAYGAEPQMGSYDALNGLLLQGDGTGSFSPLSIAESGVFIPGDGKALVKFEGADGGYLVAASQNSGPLKVFQNGTNAPSISFNAQDAYAVIYSENGGKRKMEAYHGSSFQSASARFFRVPEEADSVKIVSYTGDSRTVNLE